MKKAELPTGARGFTLLETLFAILILSSGIIYIAPAMFRSGALISHVACGYEADLLLENLMVQKEEDLRTHHEISQMTSKGVERKFGVDYSYEEEAISQDSWGRLYLLTVRVAWKDLKQNHLERTVYLLQ